MATSKSKKSEALEKIKTIVDNSASVVFVNFHGLTVSDITAVRKSLKEKGVNYLVVKKTLLKKALENKSFSGSLPSLEGELALVYGNDQLAPSREIYTFQKQYKDSLTILGGIFEEGYQNKTDAIALATIPPLQVLYGQFVGLLASPVRSLAVCLAQIAEKQA
jgi:large subunit ribosomal protein L10